MVLLVLVVFAQSDISWLAGCWQWQRGSLSGIEAWVYVEGETWMGVNAVTKEGQRIEHEYLMIEWRDDQWIYVATPSRQARTEFKLVERSEHRLVFSNPDHDFPKRIIYELVAVDRLVATVDGGPQSDRQLRFEMKAVPCSPTPEDP